MNGVWETFRGNPWDNRGLDKLSSGVGGDGDGGDGSGSRSENGDVFVEAKLVARKVFYEQRAKCEFI